VLLFGPTGTGKSTLCQSIAQKMSIRISTYYSSTRMIQIKAASLLSKYFSESAKIVDDICTSLARLCTDEPNEFNCILIDEVESLTMSRKSGSLHGESQDTLRATNALLTGLDRLKAFPNIIFLCTSNMPELMDSAFLNRCSLQIAIEPPTMESRYSILRQELQRLICNNIISYCGQIPVLSDAKQEKNAGTNGAGSCLLDIVKYIGNMVAESPSGAENSARFLSQLPQEAIELYLRNEECSLQMAYSFMERFLRINGVRDAVADIPHYSALASEEETYAEGENAPSETAIKIARSRDSTGKRKLRILAEGDEDQVFEDLWTYLQGRYKKARPTLIEQRTSTTSESPIRVDRRQREGSNKTAVGGNKSG
jgi:hypothetical protein